MMLGTGLSLETNYCVTWSVSDTYDEVIQGDLENFYSRWLQDLALQGKMHGQRVAAGKPWRSGSSSVLGRH